MVGRQHTLLTLCIPAKRDYFLWCSNLAAVVQHRMAIWAYRKKITLGINNISIANLCERHHMMHVYEPLKVRTKLYGEIKPADRAYATVILNAR